MCKIYLLLIPVILSLVACNIMPGTGGNPDEGRCDYVLKEHADELMLNIDFDCPYESSCKLRYLNFYPIKVSDDMYCGECQYKLVKDGKEGLVKTNAKVVPNIASMVMNIDPDDHLRFSLFDINNVEKKYDIDLSGIINSFTVHRDSVDVNVMKGCSLKLFDCNKETVYGNKLQNGKYSFLKTEGCDKEYSYDCSWLEQGSSGMDEIDIHAMITWTK